MGIPCKVTLVLWAPMYFIWRQFWWWECCLFFDCQQDVSHGVWLFCQYLNCDLEALHCPRHSFLLISINFQVFASVVSSEIILVVTVSSTSEMMSNSFPFLYCWYLSCWSWASFSGECVCCYWGDLAIVVGAPHGRHNETVQTVKKTESVNNKMTNR